MGEAVARSLAAAIDSVEPGRVVAKNLAVDGNTLIIFGNTIELTGSVFALGIGKAAAAMTGAVADILGNKLTGGLVGTKHAPKSLDPRLEVILGGHPLPDEHSLAAGKRVDEFVHQLKPEDLLISLISGGGSALVSHPKEGVSLQDLQELTKSLLENGARIDEINILRRQLDSLKGGGLARMAYPAHVVSLILSDVVGNGLETIASGPTVPNPTTAKDALAVLKKYEIENQCPANIMEILQRSDKQPLKSESFEHVQNFMVGSNLIAAQAALRQAADEGFHPYLLRTDLQDEAREAARDRKSVV
jgi:glycerate 2-kinase